MEFSREKYKKLKAELEHPHITILLGARQVGKSYLMSKLRKQVTGEVFFDLEDPATLKSFHGDEEHIFNLLSQSGKYIFIDEFHYVENISKIFKIIYDQDSWDEKLDTKIYASGSSALQMHKHLQESLVGRYQKYLIRPLSYSEFQRNRDIDTELDVFLKFGALPGTYDPRMNPSNNDKQSYLERILDSYIQKDVKALVAEENMAAFNNLIYLLADSQGQVVSSSSLAKEIRVSVPTVERYISLLEQTFVLYTLRSFAGNLSNELKKSKKYYLYDLGVRNSLLKDFGAYTNRKDKGCILETFVYHQLLNMIDSSDTEIFFWRTSDQHEIDFVINHNRVPIPVEVKSSLRKPVLLPALKKFLRAYPQAPCAIVVNDKFDEELYLDDYKVHFVSFENIDSLAGLIS